MVSLNIPIFFLEEDKNFSPAVELIDSVSIVKDNGQLTAVFSGENEKLLYSASNIKKVKNAGYLVQDNSIHLSSDILITYGSQSEVIRFTESRNFAHDGEMATILYDNGFINEATYIENISKWLLDAGQASRDSQIYIERIKSYANKKNVEELPTLVEEVLEAQLQDQAELYALPSTYVTSASGRFRVYYPSSDYSPEAHAIAAEMDLIDAKFCTQWGLTRPSCAIGLTTYNQYVIHIVDYATDNDSSTTETTLAQTPNSSYYPQRSHITVGLDTAEAIWSARNSVNFADKTALGTLAHEYMHAIFWSYGIPYNTVETQWMHEAFAVFAGSAYHASTLRTLDVRTAEYLDNSFVSLPNMANPYGGVLFPLYIFEQCGGANTIKKILEQYVSCNDPVEAIESGLIESGILLSNVFPRYAAYNSNTVYFYSMIDQNSHNPDNYDAFPSNFTSNEHSENYPWPTFSTYIPPLAYHTYQFNPPSSTSSTITITVDFSNILGAGLYSVHNFTNGSASVVFHATSTGRSTIVQSNFSTSLYQSIKVIPSNSNSSGASTSCVLTATKS